MSDETRWYTCIKKNIYIYYILYIYNIHIYIYIYYIYNRLWRESPNKIGRASGPTRKKKLKEKMAQSILWLRTLVSVALASLSDSSGEIRARTTIKIFSRNERRGKISRFVLAKSAGPLIRFDLEERKIKSPIIKRQEAKL